MGGRGASSGMGKGRGSGPRPVTSFQDGDAVIDLVDAPLVYGSRHNLGDTDKATRDFENKRRAAKVEYGTTIAPDGTVIGERRGGKGSVRTPISEMMRASTFSHIHPREAGTLGGTFSPEDLQVFVRRSNLNAMRAAAKEGQYSIMRGPNFDGDGLLRYYAGVNRNLSSQQRDASRALQKSANDLVSDYMAGRISTDQYNQRAESIRSESKNLFNKTLVGLHNALLDGQAKYGYSYTLEPKG